MVPSSRQIPGLATWLGVTYFAAGIGAIASFQAGPFYGELARPNWAPPVAVFTPLWTVLYTLMAVAAWLVWREDGFRGSWIALTFYLIKLVLNAGWSWIFFTWHLGIVSFTDMLLLELFIFLTLVAFWRVRPLAGWLMVPYLLWETFAVALNYSLWKMNPDLTGP